VESHLGKVDLRLETGVWASQFFRPSKKNLETSHSNYWKTK